MEISRRDNEESNSNVILNHDFSSGMHSWHPNCCNAFVVTAESGDSHVIVKNRNEFWQGLEQDITSRVKPSYIYKVSANVSVSGPIQGLVQVQATLKLKNRQSPNNYQFIAKACVFKEKWVRLEGMFSLPSLPERVVFYLEGPSRGIDLLIQSVSIHRESEPMLERKESVTAEVGPVGFSPSALIQSVKGKTQIEQGLDEGWAIVEMSLEEKMKLENDKKNKSREKHIVN